MPHFSRQTIAIIAMMLIIIVPAAANASDHDTEETKTTTTTWEPRLSFWFDDDLGILVFGPTDPTAEEALDCTPTGDPLTVDEECSAPSPRRTRRCRGVRAWLAA